MKAQHLSEILQVMGGTLIKGDINTIIKDAAIGLWGIECNNTMFFHLDKRSIRDLDALNRYEKLVIVTEQPEEFNGLRENSSIVHVTDVKQAYWSFVDFYRGLFNLPIIGITGTCGKTTTTEMIKHILQKKYKIASTRSGNNANVFSLQYLLGIDDNTEAAAFEMGVDNPGSLSYNLRHFKPQIRILLNIGVYHILGCKTLEGYIKAKAELLEGLDPAYGTLILNADDENIKKIDVSSFHNIIYFGAAENASFRVSNIKDTEEAITFTLHHENKSYEVYLPGLGRHNAYNAAAAIASVTRIGVSIDEAIESFKTYKPMIRHLQLRRGPKESTILDDNWNNTPPSMVSALQVLKDIAGSKLKIAVFGQMYNLGTGDIAEEQYSVMGEKVVEAGVDILVIIGEKPVTIGKKALELGMDKDKVFFINNGDEVPYTIYPYLNKNTIILLKACEDKVKL